MGLTATANGGGSYTPAPEGTHAARCVRIIDLGTQPGSQQYPSPKHKVMFAWELPNEEVEFDGEKRPAIVTKRYTMSLHEKAAMCHDLQSWRGKKFTDEEKRGFELKKVLGVPCMLTIMHNSYDGNTYANVTTVAAPLKGLTIPPAHNDLVYYEIEDGANDVFAGFSEKLQETIRQAPEWRGPNDPDRAPGASDDPGFGDDDIPF